GPRLPPVQGERLDRDRRFGHGPPQRLPRGRLRPEGGDGVRVRHGAVAHGDAEVRGRRPALVLRARRPLPGAIPMKVSFNWLRELVELKPGVTADSVAQQLTLVGLEVESIERRGRDVAGVLVAEVRGTRPHPGAEKLSL